VSQFSLTENRHVQVLEVAGPLERDRCDMFREALDEAAEAAGRDPFIVDLSNLSHINSTGLRVLVLHQRRLARQGRRFVVAGMAGPVRETMEISRVCELIDTNDSVDAAIDGLAVHACNGLNGHAR